MRERETPKPVFTGLSLLFVVLLTLCLFTFAAISLVSARHNYTSELSMAESKTAYYTACNAAEHTLAELEKGEKTGTVAFDVAIDDARLLHVELYRAAKDEAFQISAWQVQSSGEWTQNSEVNLLLPEDAE